MRKAPVISLFMFSFLILLWECGAVAQQYSPEATTRPISRFGERSREILTKLEWDSSTQVLTYVVHNNQSREVVEFDESFGFQELRYEVTNLDGTMVEPTEFGRSILESPAMGSAVPVVIKPGGRYKRLVEIIKLFKVVHGHDYIVRVERNEPIQGNYRLPAAMRVVRY